MNDKSWVLKDKVKMAQRPTAINQQSALLTTTLQDAIRSQPLPAWTSSTTLRMLLTFRPTAYLFSNGGSTGAKGGMTGERPRRL